jgi:NAD(P)-dependent dehydrogenase (short-subunit alcohol dehydrogenase family)
MIRQPTALVTGGSRGLGRALAGALLARGWHVVTDGRDATALADLPDEITTVVGDVADAHHRRALADAGPYEVLVNNASVLGPSPQPRLTDYPLDELDHVYAVNTVAPLALIQLTTPKTIINISSDAAVEPYEGWGGYGSSKAALDQLTAVLAAERPDLRVYSFDPGDMNTALHQQAFPDEDISDRPDPETVVPALLRLLDGELPSGRYQVEDLA